MDEQIPVTEARAQFSDLVNRVGFGGERIVLTRHGKPLVALVPADDLLAGAPPVDDTAVPSTRLDLSSREAGSDPDRYALVARDTTTPRA